MIKEIYCKMPTEKGWKKQIETDNEVDIIVQQVKMVLGTRYGDVLGSPGFGVDLQQFLFGYNNSVSEIKYVIDQAISYFVKFDPDRFSVACDVRFGQTSDGLSEFALVDIIINEIKVLGIFVNQE